MAGQLTIDTLKASSGVLSVQNGMTGIAKAWVQWVGTTGAIVGSFNVSSVTRRGTGQYTVNFTTAMPNANFATSLTNGYNGTGNDWSFCFVDSRYSTTTTVGANFANTPISANQDPSVANLMVFSS